MKRLVIGSSFFIDPHFRIMLDEAERAYALGDDVVFASCGASCNACIANPHSGRLQCFACKILCRWFERRFKGRIPVVMFPRIQVKNTIFAYNTIHDIKKIVYKNVNIGYAAYSEYVTLTRDLLENITSDKRRYVDYLLSEAQRYVDVAESLFDKYRPDGVSVYNGRLFETRAFFELARIKGIPVRVNEVVSCDIAPNEMEYRHFVFQDSFPQDVFELSRQIKSCWKISKDSDDEKKADAALFFENRRKGSFAGDTITPGFDGIFVRRQVRGTLPSDFDSSKRNVVIFNSSEDELTSIDPSFESHALFSSQINGIVTVVRILSKRPDYHVYLRIHPNLIGVNQPYHLELYKLSQQFSNLTIIAADSKCSTYDLIDVADKVVVLGSTAGVEATYSGKPVILIGSALYYGLDVAYKPNNLDELESLLVNSRLTPRPIGDALKYGYYLRNRINISEKACAIDLRVIKKNVFGVDRWVPSWPNVPLLNFLMYSRATNLIRKIVNILARNVMPK